MGRKNEGNRGAVPEIEISILAGGRSSRMGRDKAGLPLGGKSMLGHVLDAAVQLGLPLRTIRNDVVPRCGPLGGMLTGLKQAQANGVLFLSCDMPFITPELLRAILRKSGWGARAVFAQESGYATFPCLVPKKEAVVVRKQIKRQEFSIQKLAQALAARFVGSAPGLLTNINTPHDYEEACKRFRQTVAPVLAVSGLNIRRGRNQLITDFSWSVAPREHWVILGANGSGKTSLLSALLGYLTPTSGEISVLGRIYGDSDWRSLRSDIGLVSSSIRQMMPENEEAWITVASGRYAMVDFWGTPRKEDRAAAYKILKGIECEYIAERPWSYLSQGERQRVLIGRALMAKPALLILDEPCAGLDPAAREHFLNFLERLGRKKTAPALVLVTHHVEEIMPVFTHALLLKNGRKLGQGSIADVLNSENLSAAFSAGIRLVRRAGRYQLRIKSEPRVII